MFLMSDPLPLSCNRNFRHVPTVRQVYLEPSLLIPISDERRKKKT